MCLLLVLLCLVVGSWSVSTCETSFPCPAHCTCNLEIKFTSCSSNNLTSLPGTMPSCTEHLNLSFNQLAVLQHQAFRSTRRLRTLLLNNNQISTIEDAAFSLLEALVKLDLSRNHISSLTKGFSLGLGSLRELSLAENQLRSMDGGSFSHMDALQKLNLSHNNISFVRTFGSLSTLRRVYLDGNKISSLSNGVFSMLRNLEELGLKGNRIHCLEVGALAPLTSLTVLDLVDNQLKEVDFKAFLSLHTHSTHIWLAGNPWECNCDLQRVFRKLRSVQRFLLDDYDNLTCAKPEQLQGEALKQVDTQLCFAETVTVLIITITVVITVVAAIVMAEKNRKKIQKEKHWTEVSDMSCDSQN